MEEARAVLEHTLEKASSLPQPDEVATSVRRVQSQRRSRAAVMAASCRTTFYFNIFNAMHEE